VKMPSLPDRKGHFGIFGGRYVAETIMPAILELEAAYRESRRTNRSRRNSITTSGITREGNAAVPGAQPHGKVRRGENLPEARGPQPHGFP